ncbi:MAG: AzlC family ABC transporter permease [Parasporobacterium sp.]|nr:AzlC family ABC transporter permease [Parasporobacterium sp.]
MVSRKRAFTAGMKAGIPIALGYFAVSFTFGMMAVQSGLTVFQATLISLTNLTSAGQFASLAIITAGGSLLELALNQFIINLRYLLMGFSLSQKLDRNYPFFHKFFVAFGITDEIYGVAASRPGKNSPWYHYGAMALAIPGWTLGTLVGAAAGQILPQIVMSALSVAIYGMFLAIIIPPAKKNHFLIFVILSAMALGAVFRYVPGLNKISSGFVVIIITVLVSAVAAILRPIKEEDHAD